MNENYSYLLKGNGLKISHKMKNRLAKVQKSLLIDYMQTVFNKKSAL